MFSLDKMRGQCDWSGVILFINLTSFFMAETSEGKKKVYVHEHTKEDGTKVKTHYRSTPNTSSGKKNK